LWEQVSFTYSKVLALCVSLLFFCLLIFCSLGVHQYPFLHARAFSIVAKFSSVVGLLFFSFPPFFSLFSQQTDLS
jgi:hypothetical protein